MSPKHPFLKRLLGPHPDEESLTCGSWRRQQEAGWRWRKMDRYQVSSAYFSHYSANYTDKCLIWKSSVKHSTTFRLRHIHVYATILDLCLFSCSSCPESLGAKWDLHDVRDSVCCPWLILGKIWQKFQKWLKAFLVFAKKPPEACVYHDHFSIVRHRRRYYAWCPESTYAEVLIANWKSIAKWMGAPAAWDIRHCPSSFDYRTSTCRYSCMSLKMDRCTHRNIKGRSSGPNMEDPPCF